MNIFPPMMTVWYHLVQKYLGDSVDVTIFDCSGYLHPEEFPHARVQKFLNFYAATKSDEFLASIASHRRIGWICDDDVFFVGQGATDLLRQEFSKPKTATVSFRPRNWWHFAIDGTEYPVSGSYCLAIDRDIFMNKEHLSLRPCDGNTHPSSTGKTVRRYDTFDKANEELLRRGYRCAIIPEEESEHSIAAFSGLSGAVMLLWYFRTPEQTLNYFRAPPVEQWKGNLLFGLLSALLAVCTIQECYEQLCGSQYPLPSLPSRKDLETLRREREPHLREDQSFAWIDEVSEHLRAAL